MCMEGRLDYRNNNRSLNILMESRLTTASCSLLFDELQRKIVEADSGTIWHTKLNYFRYVQWNPHRACGALFSASAGCFCLCQTTFRQQRCCSCLPQACANEVKSLQSGQLSVQILVPEDCTSTCGKLNPNGGGVIFLPARHAKLQLATARHQGIQPCPSRGPCPEPCYAAANLFEGFRKLPAGRGVYAPAQCSA